MKAATQETGMELNLLNLFKNVENPGEYAAGDTIFTEGTPGDIMYVVLEGSVEISVDGKTLEVSGPGSLVGEMALIDASARSATALAKENCKLAPVGERQFLKMVEQTPYFALHVMKVLTDRLRRMDTLNRA
jgi:CRP-like cAMP-binding protein